MSRLGTFLIVVLAMALAYTLFRAIAGDGPVGSQRLVGRAAPEFAAPLAGSGLNGDSNVLSRSGAKASGETAACDVKLEGAFVSCRDLAGRAVIVFWNPDDEICVRQVDALDRYVRSTGRDVDSVAVALRPEAGAVERQVEQRGWELPVAIDRDGAVGVLYGVGACPTSYFVERGKVIDVRIGLIDQADLAAALRTADDGEKGATGDGQTQ